MSGVTRVFSLEEFTAATGLDDELAAEFLTGEEGFLELGLVERVGDGFRVTDAGREVIAAVLVLEPQPGVPDHSRPARHRRYSYRQAA